MKKFAFLLALIGMTMITPTKASAATLAVYYGSLPGGCSVTINSSNQIEVTGFTGTLRVDYTRHNPHDFWSAAYYAPCTFDSYGADEIAIQFYLSYYPYSQVIHYYVYY
jgi:hypothetical protein